MKAFIFYVTSNEAWEWCPASYLVIADSKEEAESILEIDPSFNERDEIETIEEIDLSVKGQVKIQDCLIE